MALISRIHRVDIYDTDGVSEHLDVDIHETIESDDEGTKLALGSRGIVMRGWVQRSAFSALISSLKVEQAAVSASGHPESVVALPVAKAEKKT